MNGDDNGVWLSGCEKGLTPISGGTRPDRPAELQCSGLEEQNSHKEQNEDTTCVALLETNMTQDRRDAQSMLASNQLPAAHNYKVMNHSK